MDRAKTGQSNGPVLTPAKPKSSENGSVKIYRFDWVFTYDWYSIFPPTLKERGA
jgi:hypothetical protein